MIKHLCISTILAGSFILSPAFAEDNPIQINISGQQKILLAENDKERTSNDSSSRGRVTQGVIGAEAEENRKLVPEESAAEKKEQESPSNIRLPEEIEEDVNPPIPESE